MNFDVIIIGGGLAGLVCGIHLQNEGKSVLIVSDGQSALHFWSGSFDLLSCMSDGHAVESPSESIAEFVAANPEHPYAKLPEGGIDLYAGEAKDILSAAGIMTDGDVARNRYVITPLGELKRTWLTQRDFLSFAERDGLPFGSASIITFDGFLDFFPEYMGDALRRMGSRVDIRRVDMEPLSSMKNNAGGMKATHMAHVFNDPELFAVLADRISIEARGSDIALLPACLGLDDKMSIERLSELAGVPVKLLAAFPPSVAGVGAQRMLRRCFERCGGVYMLGDRVTDVEIECDMAVSVRTVNHGLVSIGAKSVVLAGGSFCSRGLVATHERIYEPLLGLDLFCDGERRNWCCNRLFDDHPYLSYGVVADSQFRPSVGGRTIGNLYAVGAILGGFNPIAEGSGAGVSIVSALAAADNILSDLNRVI